MLELVELVELPLVGMLQVLEYVTALQLLVVTEVVTETVTEIVAVH